MESRQRRNTNRATVQTEPRAVIKGIIIPDDAAIFGIDEILMIGGGFGAIFNFQFDAVNQRCALVIFVLKNRMRQNYEFSLWFFGKFAREFQC